jgi:hypothetical protein
MMWHRRHALQIAAQLPDDPKDALIVLDHARRLVEEFLRTDAVPGNGNPTLRLVELPRKIDG